MTEPTPRTSDTVEVVPYDPRWPSIYAAERDLLLSVSGGAFLAFEHIGSTAVPGQRAKPIIDMMAALETLQDDALLASLAGLGYELTETGMRGRLFLRRSEPESGQVYHLHLVEFPTWEERKERLMRDHLRRHPETVEAYGALKDALAVTHANDMPGYTRAKTAFIQGVIDRERDARGLPRVDVWEE